MAMTSRRILLGHIAGAHGIRGDVLIETYTGAPEDIARYGALSNEPGDRSFIITVRRVTVKGVLASIEGVRSRTEAEALKGTRLYVDRERLPATGKNEFYRSDLIGLAAVSPEGRTIGEVIAVENYGAGDLIEIRLSGSRKTELIPFTDAFVPAVDLAAGRMVVVMPVATDDENEPR
jgi:16S rRNA processing protein RimM